jgi:5-methyltetrahydropteroyltriglutamate--homocysteine methyltransferase
VLADLAGKTIILGVIDLGDPAIETMAQVTARIRAGLARVTPDLLVLAPDCGMKYLPRDTAFGKLRALSDGARAVRAQLA